MSWARLYALSHQWSSCLGEHRGKKGSKVREIRFVQGVRHWLSYITGRLRSAACIQHTNSNNLHQDHIFLPPIAISTCLKDDIRLTQHCCDLAVDSRAGLLARVNRKSSDNFRPPVRMQTLCAVTARANASCLVVKKANLPFAADWPIQGRVQGHELAL